MVLTYDLNTSNGKLSFNVLPMVMVVGMIARHKPSTGLGKVGSVGIRMLFALE